MADETAAVATDDEAQDVTVSGSETEETEETPIEFPNFHVELPADLSALLEEEEYDATVDDEELDQLSQENEDVPREILARMRAAEKRSEHLEKLRVKEARKNWGEEAAKFFPLAEPFLTEINATSRRGYLRTAKEVHEKMLPIIEEKILKPARDAVEAKKTEAVAEGKEKAKEAWGTPGDAHESPSEAQVTLQRSERRRKTGDLSDTIREMMFPKGG